MRITSIEETSASIGSDISNAYVRFSSMDVSVVRVHSDVARNGRPLVGYGFSSNGRYSAGGILRERIIPRVLEAPDDDLLDDDGSNFDPHRIWDVMMTGEKPGGHGERSVAVGVVDMALWDLVAKIEDKPLYAVIAERFGTGQPDSRVWTYAAGGYYGGGDDLPALREEMRRYLDLGYGTVKMKIGGRALGADLQRIEAALGVVGKGSALAVDANGRLDPATAAAYAEALAPYDLRWFEEVGDPLDFELNRLVCDIYEGPIATGENLFSTVDARNLLRYGGMRPDRDILQFDCGLSYGLVEYLRTLEQLTAHGWSWRSVVPHGGHQMSLNIAAGLGLGGNESYPEVFRPFSGFADHLPIVDGYVQLPDAPGVGFETNAELFNVLN